MKANQDHLTQISEQKAANLALEKEPHALKLAQAKLKETEKRMLPWQADREKKCMSVKSGTY